MVLGVREIVPSVTVCSSSVVRREGGKGGGDFCPALRRNPRTALIGSLDAPEHV